MTARLFTLSEYGTAIAVYAWALVLISGGVPNEAVETRWTFVVFLSAGLFLLAIGEITGNGDDAPCPDPSDREAYVDWLKQFALKHGDWYVSRTLLALTAALRIAPDLPPVIHDMQIAAALVAATWFVMFAGLAPKIEASRRNSPIRPINVRAPEWLDKMAGSPR